MYTQGSQLICISMLYAMHPRGKKVAPAHEGNTVACQHETGAALVEPPTHVCNSSASGTVLPFLKKCKGVCSSSATQKRTGAQRPTPALDPCKRPISQSGARELV